MTTHTIRLRGPWQASAGDLQLTVTVPGVLPRELLSQAEPIVLQRKFNCPTGLEQQRVALAIENASHALVIVINGQTLENHAIELFPQRWNIARHLEPHNELTLELDVAECAETTVEIGLVSLEITER